MRALRSRPFGTPDTPVAALWRESIRFRQEILAARQQILQVRLSPVYEGPGLLDLRLERTVRIALILCTDLEATCDLQIQHYLRLLNGSIRHLAYPVGRGLRPGKPEPRPADSGAPTPAPWRQGGDVENPAASWASREGDGLPAWRQWRGLWQQRVFEWLAAARRNRRQGFAGRILEVADMVEEMIFDLEDHAHVTLAMARQAVQELSGRRFDPIVVESLMRAWSALEAYHQKVVVS